MAHVAYRVGGGPHLFRASIPVSVRGGLMVIDNTGFDGRGNYTMGVTEQLIFSEIDYDKIDRTRGMDITFVTTAPDDDSAFALLDALGFPFKDKE